MSPPPKKTKESTTISLTAENWTYYQKEQFSTVRRINGFPWRLRLFKKGYYHTLSLVCDKCSEAALWECAVIIKTEGQSSIKHTFTSWDKDSQECIIKSDEPEEEEWDEYDEEEDEEEREREDFTKEGTHFEVEIITNNDGESWRRLPTLGPFEPRDGTFVVGEEKEKIYINKKSLASQSPFFDGLFNWNWEEETMDEMPIEDVKFEEFSNFIRMIYDMDGTSLTVENMHSALQLAARFQIKIVEERIVSCLLSSAPIYPLSSLSVHQKLVISEQYNLNFLKDRMLAKYEKDELLLKKLSQSPELEQLSIETVRDLFKKSCESIQE